jgi:hypothetical protein
MARDVIKIPVFIKILIQEMFYEPGHSQNNDTVRSGIAATALFVLPYSVSRFINSLPIGHSSITESVTRRKRTTRCASVCTGSSSSAASLLSEVLLA